MFSSEFSWGLYPFFFGTSFLRSKEHLAAKAIHCLSTLQLLVAGSCWVWYLLLAISEVEFCKSFFLMCKFFVNFAIEGLIEPGNHLLLDIPQVICN